MILRYKKKDDGANQYNFKTEKEWSPHPSDFQLALSTSSHDPNKHDTPALNISKHSQSHRTIIITGVSDTINSLNTHQEFMKLFSGDDSSLVEEIKFKSKGTVLLLCKDWSACHHIASTYKAKKILDKTIFFHLFSESDDAVPAVEEV